MTATKRKAVDERPDISHQPTRKVEAMSTLAAEMLVRDADATSPGIPALDVDRALASAENGGAHAGEAAPMARLAEVRSVPPPAPRGTSPAEESAAMHAFRNRSPRVILVLALVATVIAVAAAAYLAAANSL